MMYIICISNYIFLIELVFTLFYTCKYFYIGEIKTNKKPKKTSKRGLELGTFRLRERCLNRWAIDVHKYKCYFKIIKDWCDVKIS